MKTRLISVASNYGKAMESVHDMSDIIDDCNLVTVVPERIIVAIFRVIINVEHHRDNSP